MYFSLTFLEYTENKGRCGFSFYTKAYLILLLLPIAHKRPIKKNTLSVLWIRKSTETKGLKMAIIGYIRVSSNKQTLEHQKFEIKKFTKDQKIKIDKWVEEKISSRKPLAKRQLGQLLNELKGGF